MKVGIGYSNRKDGRRAGISAAKQAIESARIEDPCLALAFCVPELGEDDFFAGLREVLPDDSPVVGGSAIGVITNDVVCYKGYPAAVAVIEAGTLEKSCVCESGLKEDEEACGKRVAEKLGEFLPAEVVFLFYDSMKVPGTSVSPPVLNSSARLLRGISESLKHNPLLLGAGLIGTYEFCPTRQFCGSTVRDDSVVALMLKGKFHCYHRIMHGCRPLDGVYHTITAIKDDVIFEIDGLPAARVIDDLYGSKEWRKEHPVKLLTIGVNCRGRFESFGEGNYVNRLITGVMPDGKNISIFEPDLAEGVEFQFMLRDGLQMVESARENSKKLFNEVVRNGGDARFALYVDCAGRTAEFSQTLKEEASEIQKVCNEFGVPLLGFYSGVEIAPFWGKSRGLDWTGVLTILALKKDNEHDNRECPHADEK